MISIHLLQTIIFCVMILGEMILLHLKKGGRKMGVAIYQARIPSELYEALKEQAYRERKSVNALVVEAVRQLLGRGDRPDGAA